LSKEKNTPGDIWGKTQVDERQKKLTGKKTIFHPVEPLV
jgi:hypothetical protein